MTEEESRDLEIDAMGTIIRVLSKLDENAVERVIDYAIKRFRKVGPTIQQPAVPTAQPAAQSMEYDSFPSLFEAARAETGLDGVLVAAYWFQIVQGQENFDSLQLNKELKHLGRPSSNITRDLDHLMNRTPGLVMQVKKSGSTKQARKKYRLTHEGIQEVREMISRVR